MVVAVDSEDQISAHYKQHRDSNIRARKPWWPREPVGDLFLAVAAAEITNCWWDRSSLAPVSVKGDDPKRANGAWILGVGANRRATREATDVRAKNISVISCRALPGV